MHAWAPDGARLPLGQVAERPLAYQLHIALESITYCCFRRHWRRWPGAPAGY